MRRSGSLPTDCVEVSASPATRSTTSSPRSARPPPLVDDIYSSVMASTTMPRNAEREPFALVVSLGTTVTVTRHPTPTFASCAEPRGACGLVEHDRDARSLTSRSDEPALEALRLHPFYRGKIQTALKCPIRTLDDFAVWYTPGVAASSRAIAADPELVYSHTNKANTIAIVSDGSSGARPRRHRPRSRAGRDGGQGAAVQIPRRGRCRSDLCRRPQPRRHRAPGRDAAAVVRRRQPRRHLAAQVPEVLDRLRASMRIPGGTTTDGTRPW